jgi:hypothetical protein
MEARTRYTYVTFALKFITWVLEQFLGLSFEYTAATILKLR